MTLLVRAAPESHYPWLLERIGLVPSASFRAIEATDEHGALRGMVGYDNWTRNSVQVHMATSSPIVWRSLLKPAFRYPFEQAGLSLLLGLVSSDNAASMNMTRAMGFRETYRILDGSSPGVDLVLFEMRRHECRWLSDSQESRSH